MIRAALFDLDGTLINTLDDIADSANYALVQRGYAVHDVGAYRYFVGNGAANLMRRILPEDRRTPEEIEILLGIYAPYYLEHSLDKSRPYDGITALLDELKGNGVRIAVVSNKPDDQTQFTLSKLFPPETFDFAVGSRDDFPLKPDPTSTLFVLKTLGVRPNEAVFVGDTGVDMRTAHGAGCLAVGVTWGFRDETELRENGAELVINEPNELTQCWPVSS
jgi:phosphoglycolate phosphatase